MASGGNRDLRQALEIADLRSNHDIDVLGAAHHAPGIDGQASDDDEPHVGVSQPSKQLVEGWSAQLLRAAPVNCISL